MTDAAKAVPPYYERGLNSSVNCFNGYHADCIMRGCSCACHSARLTAVEEPAIAAQQRPICGHCGQILTGGIQRCSNDGYCCKEGQPELEAKEATGDFLYRAISGTCCAAVSR